MHTRPKYSSLVPVLHIARYNVRAQHLRVLYGPCVEPFVELKVTPLLGCIEGTEVSVFQSVTSSSKPGSAENEVKKAAD